MRELVAQASSTQRQRLRVEAFPEFYLTEKVSADDIGPAN